MLLAIGDDDCLALDSWIKEVYKKVIFLMLLYFLPEFCREKLPFIKCLVTVSYRETGRKGRIIA